MKHAIKSAARRLGLEIGRFDVTSSRTVRLHAMLAAHGVNLVLDVGANTGQFGRELRDHARYRGRIVSFEPMKTAHELLLRTAAGDGGWHVAERAAIGAGAGSITINVSANSVSSSALPMLENHAAAAPASRYQGTEEVPLVTLDSVALQHIREDDVAFLKIDTQGYEGEVLKGATQILRRVVGLQLELSLVPLYAGQKLMPELMAEVVRNGFELWGVDPAFVDPRTGRMLQIDATFFRTPL